jgi:hypothetical protein
MRDTQLWLPRVGISLLLLTSHIAAVARNRKGEAIADLSQRIDARLDAAGMEQIQHNGMTYHNGLQLPPGDYNVRFVVRDSLGNRIGSVAAPLKVTQ